MSCLSCSCQFQWPMDSVGIKRDPVNCEKAWLDFTVRLLSREAVGKGRGQETVWSTKCKPFWWDSKVTHPWKNPTANPKDTKEVLLDKFLALESHLREENRFPAELEEECLLWKEGKYRELFLMTSLTSLLGKVASVHSAIEDACVKVNDLNANVNQSILANIQNCLTASLNCTKQLNYSKNIPVSTCIIFKRQTKKREFQSSCFEKENLECSPSKQKKSEPKPSFKPTPDLNGREPSTCLVSENEQQPTILALAQKLLAKRKSNPQTSVNNKRNTNTIISNKRPQREILPKTVTSTENHISTHQNALNIVPNNLVSTKASTTSNCIGLGPSPAPVCTVTVTPEQLSYFLSHNTPTQSTAGNTYKIDTKSIDRIPAVLATSPTEPFSNLTLEPSPDFREVNIIGNGRSNLHPINSKTCSPDCSNHLQTNISEPATNLSEMFNNPNRPSDMILEMDYNPNSSSLENAITSVSTDSELDLNFLDNLDLDKLCGELFSNLQSSDIDPHNALGRETETCKTCSTVDENPDFSGNRDGGPSMLELDKANGSKYTSLNTSPSCPDKGYCTDSSSPTNAVGDPMQEVADLNLDSFLFDNIFPYAENPFFSDC